LKWAFAAIIAIFFFIACGEPNDNTKPDPEDDWTKKHDQKINYTWLYGEGVYGQDGLDDNSGKNRDGGEYGTDDKDGYNALGFKRDGYHVGTGKLWDEKRCTKEGWNIDDMGYDQRGFHRDTKLYVNGKRWDEDNLDFRGYTKVPSPGVYRFMNLFLDGRDMNVVVDGIREAHSRFKGVNGSIKAEFQERANLGVENELALKDSFDEFVRLFNILGLSPNGDRIMLNALIASGRTYIPKIHELLTTSEQKEKFVAFLEVYRTEYYLDGRKQGNKSVTEGELPGLYADARAKGVTGTGYTELRNYLIHDYIYELSENLNVHPGLIECLFECSANFERIYSFVDDIREVGQRPIQEEDPIYIQQLKKRDKSYIRSFISGLYR
jgi:hypothetical protein